MIKNIYNYVNLCSNRKENAYSIITKTVKQRMLSMPTLWLKVTDVQISRKNVYGWDLKTSDEQTGIRWETNSHLSVWRPLFFLTLSN